MKRTTLNLMVDLVAALLLMSLLLTGYILRFPLPPGSNKTLGLWGLTRHQWGEFHFWISVSLLAVILMHFALHWEWVVTVVRRQLHLAPSPHRSRLLAGVLTALICAGAISLFAWAAHRSVRELAEPCCSVEPSETASEDRAGAPPIPKPPMDNPRIAFWDDVYSILERSCLNCHGPRRAAGGFRADRREDYFRTDRIKPLVVPGYSAESPLIEIVSGARPDIVLPERHRLSAREVSILKAWIDEGASWPDRPEK